MSHLTDLVDRFYQTSKADQNTKIRLVLEMIEYTITYPPAQSIENYEISFVRRCVQRVIRIIEARGEHLLADRIDKIWKKREHLLQIAENAHHLKGDYMDDIEYHEEIMWLRNQIEDIPS
jgi:hypothetical protein